MIELHPQIVTKDGEKQFVILPYDEFAAIQEALADIDDLNSLRKAKSEEHDAPTAPLEEVIDSLGLSG
jgi:PHD/YefM family antitoxin component YafN of YafNO toxin-antitoxin module